MFRKNAINLIGLLLIMSLSLVGCGGGGTSATGGVVSGNAQKGPYLANAIVVVSELDAEMRPTGLTVQGLTDSFGAYFIHVPWSGLSEVNVTGHYHDERTGEPSLDEVELNCYGMIEGETVINVNVLCHLSSERAAAAMATATDKSSAQIMVEAADEIKLAFDLSADTVLHQIDLTDGAGEHVAENAVLLLLSSAIVAVAGDDPVDQAADVLEKLAGDLADDGVLDFGNATTQAIAQAIAVLNLDTDIILPGEVEDPPTQQDFISAYPDGLSWANVAPEVHAGADQAVDAGAVVTLSGSALDSDGSVTATRWRQLAGPSVALTPEGAPVVEFTAPVVSALTNLVFELQADDDQGGSNTDTVMVSVSPRWAVSGNVTGLEGQLELNNSNNETLVLTAEGEFSFDQTLADGAQYQVTVATQPDGQTCSVANHEGSAHGPVADIYVICHSDEYALIGTIQGLDGTLTLQNNQGDPLIFALNGSFKFPGSLEYGDSYAVSIVGQPSGQTCVVSNAKGTVYETVISVKISCVDNVQKYSVWGSVSGLRGSLVLSMNGAEDLSVSDNGVFAFSTRVPDGGNFEIGIKTQPAGQVCLVANGSGTIQSANAAATTITCVADRYSVGGTVTGLQGTLALLNNGGDTINVTQDGSFTFATPVMYGNGYAVSIATQPEGQTCSVSQAQGTVHNTVTEVQVACIDNVKKYSVWGFVSGLHGSLVLSNNGTDDLTVTEDGVFSFSTLVPDGDTFEVSVKTQPTAQICTVEQGSGTIQGANATVTTVTCIADRYSVGGTVTGLQGTLTLQNNGGDSLTVSQDGSFSFATPVFYEKSYVVSVSTQPEGQTCSVSNGDGVVTGLVTDVQVVCTDIVVTYNVKGIVSGLSGSLLLSNNGGDELTVVANGDFTFATPVADGSTYAVAIKAQPKEQVCVVEKGSGTIQGADAITTTITCVPDRYTVGGIVTGLKGSLTILNNGSDSLTLTQDGHFTFAVDVLFTENYTVTIDSQPKGQTCLINGASGSMGLVAVKEIKVACGPFEYFGADDGVHGHELWVTNGHAAGTFMIDNLCQDDPLGRPCGSNPFGFTEFNGQVYFSANNGTSGAELWKTDGTPAGTVMVHDFCTGVDQWDNVCSGYPSGFTLFNSALYFSANNGTQGTELWKTDGTSEGTVLVHEFCTGSDLNGNLCSGYPSGLTLFNKELYFSANTDTQGTELWKTDGTSQGTVLVHEFCTGIDEWGYECSGHPWGFTSFNNALYFSANNGTQGTELWKTDGTSKGTVLVHEFCTGVDQWGYVCSGYPWGFAPFNNALYFSASNDTQGTELWKTDGTSQGTVLVHEFCTGSDQYGNLCSGYPSGFTVFNKELYFSAYTDTLGTELWKTDGTSQGTVLVHDFCEGQEEWGGICSGYPSGFTLLNDLLLFSARDLLSGNELFVSDGISRGTRLFIDINPGKLDSYPSFGTRNRH